MAGGSLQLCEYPGDLVRLSCAKCGRAGQYQKWNLIEKFGADIRLPDLHWKISQCIRQGKMHDAVHGEVCGFGANLIYSEFIGNSLIMSCSPRYHFRRN
jgi:hypothetical protein